MEINGVRLIAMVIQRVLQKKENRICRECSNRPDSREERVQCKTFLPCTCSSKNIYIKEM